MFSKRKYKVTPVNPANIKYNSYFRLEVLNLCGYIKYRVKNPIRNLKKSISTGEKLFNNIFVDMKVVPQIRIVINAAKCPTLFLLCIISPSYSVN